MHFSAKSCKNFFTINLKIYFQVTESLTNEEAKQRELDSLIIVKDNYEKIILSLDKNEEIFEGIKSINLINWLLK